VPVRPSSWRRKSLNSIRGSARAVWVSPLTVRVTAVRPSTAWVLIGSKASQIVQLCPVPVTVVKAKRADNKKRNAG